MAVLSSLHAELKRRKELVNASKNLAAPIVNRSELRQAEDEAGNLKLCVARHNEPLLANTRLRQSMQAGPELLLFYQPVAESFIRKGRGDRMIDSISTASPEARTAVGLTAQGKLLLVCVEAPGRGPDGHGVTLLQLASLLKKLGATQALNFDRGASTTMYLRLADPADHGRPKVVCGAGSMRQVKSVLLWQHMQ